jgi:hypothetical protein
MEPRRQREIALAVAALTVAIAAYSVRTVAPQTATAGPQSRPQAGAVASTAPPALAQKGLTDVNLSALDAPKAEPQDMVRNPFRFRPKPPPPAPLPMPSTSVAPAMPLPTGPMEPAPPPRIPLKFIGFLEIPNKGLLASLTDGRGVYRGFEGQTIEGRYRIIRIGVESIDLAYIDGRGRQTIRLTGQ